MSRLETIEKEIQNFSPSEIMEWADVGLDDGLENEKLRRQKAASANSKP